MEVLCNNWFSYEIWSGNWRVIYRNNYLCLVSANVGLGMNKLIIHTRHKSVMISFSLFVCFKRLYTLNPLDPKLDLHNQGIIQKSYNKTHNITIQKRNLKILTSRTTSTLQITNFTQNWATSTITTQRTLNTNTTYNFSDLDLYTKAYNTMTCCDKLEMKCKFNFLGITTHQANLHRNAITFKKIEYQLQKYIDHMSNIHPTPYKVSFLTSLENEGVVHRTL